MDSLQPLLGHVSMTRANAGIRSSKKLHTGAPHAQRGPMLALIFQSPLRCPGIFTALPSQLSWGAEARVTAKEPFRKPAKLYKPSVFSLVLSFVISVDN